MSTRTPTLTEVIVTGVAAGLGDVHTCMPARVVRYDPATQLADVQPEVQLAYTDEYGERQVASLPVIPACPVQFPTAGGRAIVIHPEPGDIGMIFFSEVSLDKWLGRSATGDVDPELDHRFHLSDGMFIPGLLPPSKARRTVPTGCVALGTPGGTYKRVAREGDAINVSLSDLTTALDARYMLNPGPPVPLTPVGGSVTSGSDDVKAT